MPFDRYWEWAKKPVESRLMLDGRLHNPIMALSKEDRKDRQKVNDAVERYVWPGDENGFRLVLYHTSDTRPATEALVTPILNFLGWPLLRPERIFKTWADHLAAEFSWLK